LSVAGELAATAAHEIRNPLAAIRSLVQFVKDVWPPAEERSQLLGEVLEEVDRVDRTVGNLLQLSRPQATRQDVLDLADVLTRSVQFIAPYARKRQLQLSAPAITGTLSVVGDPHELRQVIVNVLLNACQACAPGGEIVATARTVPVEDAPWAEISIRDTGHGVAAADLARVFDPFFTTKPDGTGLGLAICREVLHRHHGTITLTSTPGAGSDVILRLPLK
jgi:signal transduction histidine kinase